MTKAEIFQLTRQSPDKTMCDWCTLASWSRQYTGERVFMCAALGKKDLESFDYIWDNFERAQKGGYCDMLEEKRRS